MIKKKLENKGKNLKLTTLGFTLIELLAVIVILAIIALIATPIVLNIIEDSKKSSTLRSAEFYMDAVEYAVANRLMDNKSVEDGEYSILENGNVCLVYDDTDNTKCVDELVVEVDGEKPKSGTIKIEGKEIGVSTLVFNNGTVETDDKGNFAYKEVEDTDNDTQVNTTPTEFTLSGLATTGKFTTVSTNEESEITEVNACATSGRCVAGTEFAIRVNENETYKFYVLSDDGSKVTLIMDRNIAQSAWYDGDGCSWRHPTSDVYYYVGGPNSCGPLTALTKLKEETFDWTYIPSYSYELENDFGVYHAEYGVDADGGAWVSAYGYEKVIGDVVENVRTRLPNYTELKTIIDNNGGVGPEYLNTNLFETGDENSVGYWTSTAANTDPSCVYHFWENYGQGGLLYEIPASQINPIRPVIELPKVASSTN